MSGVTGRTSRPSRRGRRRPEGPTGPGLADFGVSSFAGVSATAKPIAAAGFPALTRAIPRDIETPAEIARHLNDSYHEVASMSVGLRRRGVALVRRYRVAR